MIFTLETILNGDFSSQDLPPQWAAIKGNQPVSAVTATLLQQNCQTACRYMRRAELHSGIEPAVFVLQVTCMWLKQGRMSCS